MDRTERFYKIDLLIRQRGCVSFADLMDELEVSRATLKRDLDYLRSRMDAPIVYDRGDNGYRFEAPSPRRGTAAATHQLPGVWFSEREIHALLTMHQLIEGLDEGGVLARHLQPLLDKLHGMLGASAGESRALMKRVKIAGAARRPVVTRHFERVGAALTQRQRLDMTYYVRTRRQQTQRVVSPQRLMHYRNTWYLDAWCHRSNGLRRFALDAIQAVTVLDEPAKNVAIGKVEAELDGGYGIFSGGAEVDWATLVFSAEAAEWVAHEQWHPAQQTALSANGELTLKLPFSDATELTMDLLRHGEQVRVVSPPRLVEQVAQRLRLAAQRYADLPAAE